jgi:iron complex outermembrane recepter protein
MKTKFLLLLMALIVCKLYASDGNEKNDSISRVYTLGEVSVSALKTSSQFQQVDMQQLQQFNRDDLASALKLLPGLNITTIGGRNEAMLYLRGFDLRQVPIYADGVPIYVPYDGYIDLSRFTTYDLSKITVSKGFTSILYGSNTLGGAINLISRKPVDKFEIGGESGIKLSNQGINGYHSALSIGSKFDKFYFLGNISLLKKNFMSLSDDFVKRKGENGGRRNHSESKDFKTNLKLGYTPNATDEYSINYIVQHAEKGIPTYCGLNTATSSYKYWEYPDWDKSSLYFISKTKVSSSTYIKANAFYDKYYNKLNAWDDSTYTTMNKKSSFVSIYDDYTAGGSAELSTDYFANNTLRFAIHEKYDVHNEHNVGAINKHFADNTLSIGAEDSYRLSSKLNAIAGISYNTRSSVKADSVATSTSNIQFTTSSSNNFNYQLGLIYNLASDQQITLSASRKSRFPTLKDRYSYKMGTAIPNPALKAEYSWNFELNYAATLTDKLQVEAAVFLNKLQDAIQSVTIGTNLTQMQNTGKATFKGFELQAGWAPVKAINAGISYSFIDRKNNSNPSILFTDVPKNKVFVYTQLNLPDADGYLQISGEYNSERISTSDGKYKAPSYLLLHAKLHASLFKPLALEFLVNNILDKNYAVVEGYPEEGRTFQFLLKYKF